MLLTAAFLVPSAFAQTAPATNALPSGGQVAAGQVTMATTGAPGSPTLNVTQGSDRAIVNWQHFDVGRDATVRFAQPSASSAILNRVVGTDASRVFGRVEANGQVFLVNPQGVYFGPNSSVDVGSFVASTLSISDADFLSGQLNFRRAGVTGVVFNEGTIRSALGGYVALLAPEVRNAGLIMAEAGTVVLAAGEAVSFNFDPAAGVTGLLVDPARVQALVDNRRIVRAPGGQVIVSAQAHNELAAGVIRNTGEIVATGIAQDGGRIYLGASDTVEQGGLVDASAAAGKGGDITVVAPTIALLDHSSLLAGGELGGGRIRVGGEWQGGGTLPQSRLVTMAAGALVDASARRVGMGGEVVLWSDVNNVASLTQAAGVIRARGGELGGDGGRVETSGRVLNVGSLLVDTRSPLGRTGDWLLDPVNITIADTGGNITPDQIWTGLLTSNVSISTAGSGSATGVSPTYSAGLGDITISSALSSLSANSLTLVADNNITVNAATSLGGALALTAGGRVTFNASVATSAGDIVVSAAGFAGVGAVTIANGGTLSVTQSGNSHYAGIIGGSGALSKAGAGALSLTGANTFTGGTTVTAGTIGVYHSTALGAGALNIGGATLRLGRGLAQVGNDIAFTGATTVVFDTAVDYLLVGGGGGGGAHVGGGGGGGGVLIGSTTLGGGTSAISVAVGGTGSTNTDMATRTAATVGANTTAFGLTAFGGGAGGNWTTVAATSGASGGGQGTNAAAIAGTQGFAGGMGDGHGNRGYQGGGGGGAGGVGGNAATDAGNGGIGLLSAITGSDTYYGGGGGGGVHGIPPLAGPGAAGLGGQGGGGAGAVYLVGVRAPGGLANTGGGGGGSGRPNNEISMGGNGGTGVVIVSYLGAAAGTGGTVTPGSNAATGRTLHTFNTTGANSLVLSALSTTLGGAISGSGALMVNATGGTISLSGANTSTGATSISGGTLRVGAGGATGALGAGAITNNAALVFNRTGTLTVAQAISGTGTVEQLAAGTTVLSGDVSHTGGTTVTAGTLRVGAGGTTGTLAGNVVSQGVLAFDRSDAFTFAGAISGAGGVTQFGSSNLILTGAATFTGVTTVDAGGIIFRRDVPPTTSGFAGVGTATVEPVTASFTSALTPAYTFASTLTGFTLGKSANATAVTIGSAISIAGPIRVFGGDVTISANVTSTAADQPIVFQAVSNVLQSAARTIQTNGGDIVYWSNSGAATTGNRGILISDSTTLDSRTDADRTATTHTSGGGVIILGGGSATATSAKGTIIPAGYALNYTSVPAGLMVGSYNGGVGHNANVRMFSGGGDVVWRGRSTQTVSGLTIGLIAFEGVIVNAGTTGNITVDGVAVGNTTTAAGMDINGYRTGVATSSYLTVNGDILFTGSGTGATNNVGTQLGAAAGFPIIIAATGAGTVTIRGTTSGTASDINVTDVQLLSGSGSVSMLVDRAGGKISVAVANTTAKLGQAAGSAVTASSASILLRADVFDVTSTNGLAINTTGAVEITSFNATGFTAASTFSRLDVGRAVASAANSIASFTLGKTTNASAITLTAGGVNALGPIRMYGSDLTIGAALRTDEISSEILLQSTGFLKTSANFTTTGATSPLRFLAGGYFYVTAASTWTTSGSNVLVAANTDGTAGGNILGNGNQSIVTSGGSVTLGGGDATASAYAEGMTTTSAEGIRYFNAFSINTSVKTNGVSTGGGDIILRGRSYTSAADGYGSWGVGVDGVTTFDSGTGSIRIDGISRSAAGNSVNVGIRLQSNAILTSASTSATAIHLTGTGGSAGSTVSGGQGIRMVGGANVLSTTGAGGGIKLSGTPGADIWALVFTGGSIVSASGPIELSGTTANSYAYIQNSPTIGFRAGTPVTASTANILLSFFDADWGNTANPIIATSGSFTFRPSGTSFNRAVSTNWFVLPNTLSGLTFGSPTNTAGVLLQSTLNVQGPVTIQGGNVYVYNPISAAGDIFLDGDTGANLAANIWGVYVDAAVSTTAASNGSITLTGRGGNTAANYGVYLTTFGHLTAGGSGALSVTGIGGANAGIGNHGIFSYANLTTSTGSLTLNGTGAGTGASSMNRGVQLVANAVLRTTTGALTLIGTGGVGANSEAFYFNDAGLNTLGAVGQSGDITIRGNSFAFGAGNVGVITSGGLTIAPTGTSFTAALSTQKFTLPALLASATLGKAGNTGDITVANAIATSGAITITGGAVALSGALSSTGGDIGITTTALTGASGITIPATKTLTLTQSGSSTYDGAISGGGSLVKSGAGTLALSASSGFTGTTSISAGTLALGGGGTSGWLTGTSSIAVDGTLQIWRGDDVTINLPLTGTGTIEVRGAYRPLFSSQLTTTAQTVASNTTVAEVMRRLAGGQLNGTAVPGTKDAAAYQVAFDPVTNVGRFQLQFYDGTYVKTVFVRLVQSGANVQALVDVASPYSKGTAYLQANQLGQDMASVANVVYAMDLATVNGGGGYGVSRLDVAGKTTLSSLGSFAGSLRLTTTTETGSGVNVYTRNIPGILEVTSGFGNLSSIVNNGLLTLNQATDTTLPNTISGTGGLFKLGAGNTTFAAAATFTGETTVAAGRLTYQDVYGSSVHTILAGATLVLDAAVDRDYVSTSFRGTGTLVKSGDGRAQWGTSVATFALGSGAMIDVQGGIFTGSSNSNEVWTNNSADLNVATGARFAAVEGNVRIDALTGAGDVTVGFTGGVGSLTLGVDNHTAGAFSTASSATFSGVIADTSVSAIGALTKLGTGTQIFSGANTYTRGTTISAGTLRIGAGGTAGVLGGAVVNNGALIFDRSDALTFAPAISGTGTLTKAGANTLTLTGANTYTGTTAVTAGGIVFQRDVAPSTSGFSGAGTVTIESAGAAFTSAVASYTYAPTITGLTLGKSTNTSAVTLGAAISIAGPVTVYGGNIAVNSVISATGDLLLDADTGAQLTGNFTGLAITANLSTTAGSNGSITLRGRGGNNSAGGQHGVTLTGVTVSAGGTGTLLIEGTGGASVGVGNIGIRSAGTITTGSGNLTLAGVAGGTGASSNNDGIGVMSGAIARTVGGALLLDGINGPGVSSESIAFETATSAVTFGQVSQTGSTTLRGDVLWVSTNNVSLLGSGAITIEPKGSSFGSALSTAQYTLPTTASGFTFGKAGNTAALTVASNLSFAGPISVFGGDVTLTGGLAATAAGNVLVRSSGVLTIAASRVLSATNGDVTLTAGRFVNNGGSGALSAGGTGKTWRVWSANADPYHVSTGDVAGGLAFDFRQYDASYGVTTVQGTGKGLLYSFAPTLSASLTTTPTKVYDRTDTATVTNAMVTVASGYTGGDGTAVFSFSAATYASRNAGNGQAITFASDPTVVAQSSAGTGSKPVYGYRISGLSAPTGNITPRDLTLTGLTAAHKVYDRSLAAVIAGGAVTPISGDTVTVDMSSATGAFANWNVGTGKTVTVLGAVLGGAEAGNYSVAQPVGLVANITARPLSVTSVTVADKVYNRALAATLSGGAVTALSGDTVTVVASGASGVFADKNVGNGKAVTVSGYALTGADAANYSLVQPTGVTANITPLTLNVTGATAASKTYDALRTVAISGGVISAISGDTVVLSTTNRAGLFSDKNVGNGKTVTVSGYAISGTDAGNYALVQPTSVTADIAALTLNITSATAANKTYDALLGATISGGAISIIAGDTVTLDTTNRAGVFADKNVGSGKSVTVSGYAISGADAANYALAQPTGLTADITHLALNVTGATAANKTYDALLAAAVSGGAISAVVGDTVNLVSSGRVGVFADKNVANGKAVTVSGYTITGADAGNYYLVQPAVITADITQLTLNVTGATASHKTYDALVVAAISGGTISAISGDTVVLDTTNRAGVFADKNVGTGKSVTVSGYTISGAAAANYALAQPTGVTADITPLTLNVTGATAASKTYDALLGAVVSGGAITAIAGDAVTLDTTTRAGAFADKNVAIGKAVTVSGYTLSGTDAGNYSLVQPTGLAADITALTLNVTGATAANKTYDALLGAVISGGAISVIAGDAVTLVSTNRAGLFADKNVANGKSVTVTGYSLTGTDAANYSLVQPTSVTADITALTLTVTGASAANKTYDALQTAAISGGTISVIAGDAVTLDASNRAGIFGDKNVGTSKSVAVSGYGLNGADAANYSLVQPTGVTADITVLSLAVTGATAANKTYDALLTAAISGGTISVIAGDAVTLDAANRAGAFADKNVAIGKAVTVSGYTLSGTDAGNYSLVQPAGLTADIAQLTLNVTGTTAANKTYDALLAAAISGGVITVISGDNVVLDTTSRAGIFGDKHVGTTKSVTVSGYTISGTDAANYSLAQPTGITADITALALNVTGATAANKTYDALLGSVISGGTVSTISGDAVTLDASNRAGLFGDKNVGTSKSVAVSGYSLTGTDATNYALVQPTGVTADITALTLNVTGATAANKTYDSLLGSVISGGAISAIAGDDATLDSSGRTGLFADKNVGTGKAVTVSGYTLTGTDAGNYSLVQPSGASAEITQLTLAVTGATAANKTYDALLTATISGGTIGAISGDIVSLDTTNRSGVFADKNIGTSKSVAVSGYSLTGADATNYALVQPAGVTADITPLTLDVTGATASNKTYDALVAAAISGGSISVIAGDAVTLDTSNRAGVFGDKNVGTSKSVTVSGYTISGADAANYSLVQPTGVTADITVLSLAVTGATAANKTYDALLSAAVSGGIISTISGDDATLDSSGRTGLFGDKNVGTAKAITVSGYTIYGTDAANYALVQPTGVTADVTQLTLNVIGATAADKTYDALLTAGISGGAVSAISGDDVVLGTANRAGLFGDKDVGASKAVTVSGYAISGADAANYSLVQPTGVTASITQLTLNLTGVTAADKTYDAQLTADVSGGSIAPISGDNVTLDSSARSGLFVDKNVGTAKAVTVSGYTISGTDAANYALVQTTGVTADITALALNVTGATAANKTYDALRTAVISGGAVTAISGDLVTLDDSGRAGLFADKNIGTSKTVTVSGYAISGADAANYSLVQPTGVSADITPAGLVISGLSASNKTYDRSLSATLMGGTVTPVAGDTVTLNSSSVSAVFVDWTVGAGKPVTVSGYALTGADAGNYVLTQPSGLTADIFARSLPVVGVVAANKLRNGSLNAEISGGSIAPLAGDTVTLDASAAVGMFLDDLIGAGKPVVVSGFALGGLDAGNYAIAQPTGVTAGINDAGVFYPPVVAPPAPVFVEPVATTWAPPSVSVSLQGPASAAPQLIVSALSMPSSAPDVVPVGAMLYLSTVGAIPVMEVSVEIVGGFVAGDTLLQVTVPEGLKVSVDDKTGKVTISGQGSPADYDKVLKTLAVRSAGGKRVGGLTLRVGVNTAQGGKSSTTVQLRQGSTASAK